jgi:hypothetical protein
MGTMPLELTDGVYNLLAYVENPNPTAEILQDTEYVFQNI